MMIPRQSIHQAIRITFRRMCPGLRGRVAEIGSASRGKSQDPGRRSCLSLTRLKIQYLPLLWKRMTIHPITDQRKILVLLCILLLLLIHLLLKPLTQIPNTPISALSTLPLQNHPCLHRHQSQGPRRVVVPARAHVSLRPRNRVVSIESNIHFTISCRTVEPTAVDSAASVAF